MKTDALDFILCSLVLIAVIALDLAVVMLVIRPLSTAWLADYHVVGDLAAGILLYGLISAGVLRAILALRPVEPGTYEMDSPAFRQWKLFTVVYRLGQSALTPFAPVFARPLVARLFGARVGRDVAIGGTIDDPYLVTIGNGAVLGNNSLVAGSAIVNGRITLGRVVVGPGATVGVNAVVLPGAEIGEHALIVGGSIVLAGTRVPASETWRGNPARKWQ